ncbi:MAG: fibronectin type III domain-containing protein [Pseudomonadota bacterium]
MRGYAAASISLLVVAAIGCGNDPGHGPFLGDEGVAGRASSASAGKSGSDTGEAGESAAGSTGSGEAGAVDAVTEGGSAGSEESTAGADTAGARDNGGTGGAAPAPTAPSAPTDLMLQVLSGSSVHLAWTDNADNETSYDVFWSATAEKPSKPNTTLAADVVEATADGLGVGQEYSFWVEASNAVGPSAAITGEATPLPVPAQPTGLVVAAGASDAVLSWTDVATTETGYRVYFATTNTQPTAAQYELPADTTQFTVTDSDITPYTQYYYWVVAYNAIGNSAPTTSSATTGVLPGAPTSVTVSSDASVWYVSASWLDNSTNTSSYNIYWSTDDNKPALAGATVSGDQNNYKMTQKNGDQTYTFWVESVNAIGKSLATKGIASTKTYDLVWTDLYYDLTNNTIRQGIQDTFGLLTDPAPDGANTALWGYHTSNKLTKGTASSLAPGITWNVAGESIDTTLTQYFWAEARTPLGSQFSVRSLVPPTPIAGFTATATSSTAALSWTASSGVQTYQLYRATGTPQTPAAFADAKLYSSPTTAPTASSPLTLTDLNPGTPYGFWVRALGTGGINGTGLPTAFASKSVTIAGTYVGPNLAIGKTAVASSATGDVASRAIDGNTGTRWQAGTTAANEWIYVNLGDGVTANFTHVKLVWESAYAKTYDIEVCPANCDDTDPTHPNTWAWQLAYTTPTAQTIAGFPYYQMVQLTTPITGQFIRMKAKTLALAYGASLYEFEVFSAP